ncbi:MAG: molybdate ABC transporter substrate-binding protein [Dermatophilaceae bacterium]
MRTSRPVAVVAVAAAALSSTVLGGCASSDRPASQTSTTPTTPLTVFAAASLRATFTQLGTTFEAANPGTSVRLSFAGSSDLVAQLQQGAAADVLASADTKTMDKAASDGLLDGPPVGFASNTLEVAVPAGNPAGIASFSDLTRPGVKVVVCAPQVPCGSATVTLEKAAGVTLHPVSEESSVTDVLGKLTSGQADAGLVYVTDVLAAGDTVAGVPVPESSQAVNVYPIAVLTNSANPAQARSFVQLVTGPQGQQVLADAGFAKP